MVSKKEIDKQLKSVGFNIHGWGRAEVRELPNIILPGEQIFELVNGIYEGGFALLVATDVRVLLVDKKPLNYLTVEDLRFEQINEIDYSHRVIGANVSIASGTKQLKFRNYNQQRLRKLITHVQHCMAEGKKKESTHREGQHQNLERMNEKLQEYLVAQQQQQQKLYEQLQQAQTGKLAPSEFPAIPEPVRPSPELADYLYAQGLLAQHRQQAGQATAPQPAPVPTTTLPAASAAAPPAQPSFNQQLADLYATGMQEVFGRHQLQAQPPAEPATTTPHSPPAQHVMQSIGSHIPFHGMEVNPLRIAYSKLPMALRNRKFGRPSFHAHSSSQPAENVSAPLETAPEPAV